MEKYAVWSLVGLVIVSLLLSFGTYSGVKGLGGNDISQEDVQNAVTAALASQDAPVVVVPTAEAIAALVVIPSVESADNVLLNEFLEVEFEDEYEEIEDEAEDHALDELEDHDYRVLEDYLNALYPGLDEDSFSYDVEDTDVEVTRLGLEEDTDRSATVTFEVEVEYEFENGVVEEYRVNLVVVYNVVYDEGNFNDETVELVSIV